MKLKGIHFLLTYLCNFECDHCFLYCSSRAKGTFTLERIIETLGEIKKIDSVASVSFEGGEPFLLYPLLLEAIKLSHQQGLRTTIETNTYWATTEKDAELWLKPLHDAGLSLLDVSDDSFHHGDTADTSAKRAINAAKKIGLKTNAISIDKPKVGPSEGVEKGEPVYQGGPKLRGRAVDKLAAGLPTRPADTFVECPYEDLRNPSRVHLDAFGNVHLCQGLLMGNAWETPLAELVKNYDPDAHPICGPILKGGPAELAKQHRVSFEEESVDACHFCTRTCKALIDRFPQYLGPRQVYGLDAK